MASGKIYGDALMAVREALVAGGELRFPYVEWKVRTRLAFLLAFGRRRT